MGGGVISLFLLIWVDPTINLLLHATKTLISYSEIILISYTAW